MKLGVLGLIVSDLSDVDERLVGFARELGFHGLGAHLTQPAKDIDREVAVVAAETVRKVGLEFFQLWGPYPSIVSPDDEVRARGINGAQDLARLAAVMGVPASGVRPTSHNPRGDWWPHPENHSTKTEETFIHSLSEILEVASGLGVNIVLEKHQYSILDSAERVRRVIEKTDPNRVRVNIDTVNFVSDLYTAFNPTPMINTMFDVLGPYCATVHLKDYYLEERFALHVSETIPGTGIHDLDTVLLRSEELGHEMYVVIEHLPVSQIALAKQNLMNRVDRLGIQLVR